MTRNQKKYNPIEAIILVPSLEICWGSYPANRPNDDHRYDRFNCVSRTDTFSEQDNLGITNDHKRDILRIFSRHFDMHSLILDQYGSYRSVEQIHFDCINEMYSWCRAHYYFRLSAYLFSNSYSLEPWKLWARSESPQRMPVLKTTMIIHSHRGVVKHDFLYKYNRPRIYLIYWARISHLVPKMLERMSASLNNNHRLAKAAWRKEYKNQWKILRITNFKLLCLQEYDTDPIKWTCACDLFLLSRFLLCKHILFCFGVLSYPVLFFLKARRKRRWPFWDGKQFNLRPEHRIQGSDMLTENSDQIFDDDLSLSSSGSNGDSVEANVVESEDENEEALVLSDDETQEIDVEDGISIKLAIASLLEEQKNIGNVKLL